MTAANDEQFLALAELEASLDELARLAPRGAGIEGWIGAQRKRLEALATTVREDRARGDDAVGEMLRALADVAEAEDDSIAVALDCLMRLTRAERGFVVLRARDGSVFFSAARTRGACVLGDPEHYVSRSILRAALAGESSVTVADALADDRFSKNASVQALALRAVLAVPMTTAGRTWGAVYLDNPLRAGAFTADACRVAEQLTRVIGSLVERDLALREADREHAQRGKTLRSESDFSSIIGDSGVLLDLLGVVARVAPTEVAVLIEGEAGTGKELIAERVHALSRRATKPFRTVRCNAHAAELEAELFGQEHGGLTGGREIHRGAFEATYGGTVFLDEVGVLSLGTQKKLLGVLVDGAFQRAGSGETLRADVRVIAATNRDLAAEVAAGRFRADLLYRLNVIRLRVPPLRERDGDVPLLAAHFLERYAREHEKEAPSLHALALAALEEYRWPGNVRELADVVLRAVVAASEPEVRLPHLGLPISAKTSGDGKSSLRAYKRRLVERALDASAGGNSETARLLGLSSKYVERLLRELELPIGAARDKGPKTISPPADTEETS